MLNGKLIIKHKESGEVKELEIKNFNNDAILFHKQIKRTFKEYGLSTLKKDMEKWIIDFADIK